jgi:hypothetical protein
MTRTFILAAAIGAWLWAGSPALGQGGMDGGGGGGGRHGGGGGGRGADSSKTAADYYRGAAPAPAPIALTPHGGEFLETETNRYEIVYMPLQVRIYLFDSKRKPLTARDVHVQMSLKVPLESAPRTIPFRYIAMPAAPEQDYVVAAFDMRQLKDADTPITFEFSGLPDRRHPAAAFTPVFSPAKIRPYVARVLLTEADRDGVMRQRTCPVSGQMLGASGPIVKLYIADYPLYVSGEDCMAAVRESPEKFLPQRTSQR